MTKRTQLFLAALVLVAILAHGYIYWWAHTDDHGVLDSVALVRDTSDSVTEKYPLTKAVTPKPADTKPEAMAVEMREYEDSTLKFNYMYPSDWTVDMAEMSGKTTYCLTEKEMTGACKVTITSVEEGQGVTQTIVAEQIGAEYRNQNVKVGSMKIGGEDAITFSLSSGANAAVFAHDKRVYTIESAAGEAVTFNGVVSTFKFY